jgi:hypothetical protein
MRAMRRARGRAWIPKASASLNSVSSRGAYSRTSQKTYSPKLCQALWPPILNPLANLGGELRSAEKGGHATEEEIAQAWQRHNQEALAEQRAAERLAELRDIIEVLDQLVPKYPPEEAGKELARVTGQNRGLTVLRDSISWLQQTLEVAEQAQERILARE